MTSKSCPRGTRKVGNKCITTLTKKQRDFLNVRGYSACSRRRGATEYKKPSGLTQVASVEEGELFRRKSDNSLWIKRPRYCWGKNIFIKLPSN